MIKPETLQERRVTGATLRVLRNSLKVKGSELCSKIGILECTLSRAETGKQELSMIDGLRLLVELKISPQQFLALRETVRETLTLTDQKMAELEDAQEKARETAERAAEELALRELETKPVVQINSVFPTNPFSLAKFINDEPAI